MTKLEQMRAFENDLLSLCQRYLHEFDIDAAVMMYFFVKTITEVLGDMIEEDLAE